MNSLAPAVLESPDGAGAPALVVIDPAGRVFGALRELQLGTAIWRTVQVPAENHQLPSAIVVLYVVDGDPPWDEIAACARIWPTVVVTERARPDDATNALRVGAFGYVDAAMPPDGLRRTLLGALRGEPAYRREVIGTWLRVGPSETPHPRAAPVDRLTARQREIVGLIAGGATDKEIGTALGIRTATAQKHVANLLRRLGVRNRAAAVGLLLKDGQRLPTTLTRDKQQR
jgi:DNA-binding NarL/FixJ family response regulator